MAYVVAGRCRSADPNGPLYRAVQSGERHRYCECKSKKSIFLRESSVISRNWYATYDLSFDYAQEIPTYHL